MRPTVSALLSFLLAAFATWIVVRTLRRRPGRAGAANVPQPGQIWWAFVPFREVDEEKHRPCLVLNVNDHYVEVLKITSQDKSHRADHVEIPTRHWSRNSVKNSFLDLSAPIRLDWRDLDRPAGVVDADTWQLVSQRHHVGRTVPGVARPVGGQRRPGTTLVGAAVTFVAVFATAGICLNDGWLPNVGSDSDSDAARGAGSTHLYTLGTVATEVGRSGQRVDSTLAGRRYPNSTGLWIGCDGAAASATYDIEGRYVTLTATVGLDTHAPAGLAAKITVSVDGRAETTVEVTRDATAPLTIDLAGARTLAFSAIRTKGTCGSATRPYGALGDAVLR